MFNNTFDTIVGTKPEGYFGIAVFTIINLVAIVIILFCYIGIFITVKQTAKQAGRSPSQKEEVRMAIKMGFIVLTDMMCRLPLVILSILVQSGRYTVTPHVYTWIVTFVLPINSAINPFLYTLSTVIFDIMHKYHNRATNSSFNTISMTNAN